MKSLFHSSVVLLFSLATGCLAGVPVHAQSDADATANRRVLILGVDGIRPDQMAAAETPHIDALIANGSYTDTALNSWTPEQSFNGESGTNWGSIFTGLLPSAHGINHNGDGDHHIDDDDYDASAGEYLTFFGHLEADQPHREVAVVVTWGGILRGNNAILAHSSGDVIDHRYNAPTPPRPLSRDILNTQATINLILGQAGGMVQVPEGEFEVPGFEGADPDLIFFHIGSVDGAGHASTYDSDPYRQSIEEIDALVGLIVDAIRQRETYDDEEWLILLIADHGGPSNERNHVNNNDMNTRTIPFLVSGDLIENGADLGECSLYDVAPTVLAWLGVEVEDLGFYGKTVLPMVEHD